MSPRHAKRYWSPWPTILGALIGLPVGVVIFAGIWGSIRG